MSTMTDAFQAEGQLAVSPAQSETPEMRKVALDADARLGWLAEGAAFFVGLAITFPFIGHSTWQGHKAVARRSPGKQLISGRAVGFLHLRYKPAWLTAVFMSLAPRTKSSPCLNFVK
jgi:hypothetical protein